MRNNKDCKILPTKIDVTSTYGQSSFPLVETPIEQSNLRLNQQTFETSNQTLVPLHKPLLSLYSCVFGRPTTSTTVSKQCPNIQL
jgi:hypothetical protein